MTDSTDKVVAEQVASVETPEVDNHIPSFLDAIPEDIRSEPSLKSIKDVSSLAKSYVNAQKMIGNSVRIPGPDASDEARKEFYQKLSSVEGVVKLPDPSNKEEVDHFLNRLGRPEKAEDYVVNLGDLPVDQEAVNTFKNMAHSIGLNKAQVQSLAQFEAQRTQAMVNDYKSKAGKCEAILKEKWGAEYENQLTAARDLMGHLAKVSPDAVNDLMKGPGGNNPIVISMAAELSKVYRERGVVTGNSNAKFGLTAEEARSRIEEVRSNVKDPLHNSSHPDHDARVEYVRNLYTLAYPDNRQA